VLNVGRIEVETITENGEIIEKRSIQNVLTYKEGHDIAVRLASALLRHELILEEAGVNLRLLGVYMRNRQEFYLADMACLLYGITCVPLYDTLGTGNLSYCLGHSNISSCICGASNAKTLLSLDDVANLKNIILC
jgi:long-chain acyl-CoA synthetase